jgi:Fur family ferric uptake transcriptional regulator
MGIKRKTQSVKVLLSEFEQNPSAIPVTELIKRFYLQINKTTIYRILDKLEDDRVLHSFLDKNGIKCYAKSNYCTCDNHFDDHPHFQCLNCGRVDCLLIDLSIPKIQNREITISQTLFQGKCHLCSA